MRQISYLNHIWTAFVWRQICFFAQWTFGSNWKNGKLHQWKVCFEIMTFLPYFPQDTEKKFNLPIFCGGERAAKQCEILCFGNLSVNQYYSRSDRRGKSTGDYLCISPQLRACLHGGGGPQVGEVTRLSISSLILIWSCLHDRWGNPPRRVARSVR